MPALGRRLPGFGPGEEILQRDIQTPGQHRDLLHARTALAPLHPTDVVAMHPGREAELLLRQASFPADLGERQTEGDDEDTLRLRHRCDAATDPFVALQPERVI